MVLWGPVLGASEPGEAVGLFEFSWKLNPYSDVEIVKVDSWREEDKLHRRLRESQRSEHGVQQGKVALYLIWLDRQHHKTPCIIGVQMENFDSVSLLYMYIFFSCLRFLAWSLGLGLIFVMEWSEWSE